jgi:hypothetical protein
MAARQYSELVINQTEELVDGSVFTMAPARKRTIDIVIGATHLASQGRLWRIPTGDRAGARGVPTTPLPSLKLL